ncbi:beta-ketoacyl-[acyl-carrier-protein] synthase family protein [Nocardioides jishulii]|uniref:Beta-ketoacyl-[acyl-carrier-protein] synthase family protein n=1 Tax=Nocardioides jishulii TaxID=2575440 RepID=A0A4U2YRY9_9ACTN|nr:beta-ketoacyl-[acyl-carrier-protein] synthase family protein [Nocardioides jishulii]QCX27945.1 beta-ketoacyl-[acyl-carrier-protein] synthase family protein [Nocardioides jishulii]TKI62751.1 beta-ketoacyl-[acyl-carrier-protein] synthase family protein [Nocardioides jishulii]
MSASRVVVTGLGVTSPVGGDVPTTWSALLAGTSGVSQLTEEWAEPLGARIAARVAVEPGEVLDRVKARRMDRSGQLAVVAATEAWADAGLAESGVAPERLAVAVASGIGGVTTLLGNYDSLLEKGPRRVSPLAIPMLMPNGPAAAIGLMLGARAGVHTPVSACASGNEAIALGIDLIRLGRADVVVCGGTEAAVHALPMAAFGQMMALSKRNDDPAAASRPWDKGRDGFVLGEGAAVLVLESEEHARARGAKVYAQAAGAGITSDSHDIAQPDPAGAGATRAMGIALREADLAAGDVVHVNAHATSTPQGDVAEALAIRTALGESTEAVVTSTKSMTGHLLGAAGALESVATILALHHRTVPATINLDDPEDVGLDLAHSQRSLPEGDLAALNNSFGFGGHNVALAFRTV